MKKIVYILESLENTGGVERIVTEKANYLAEQYKYDISIIVCTQHSDQPNAFQLSKSVKQFYLNIPLYSQYRYKYPKRLWKKYKISKTLKTKIREKILQLNPNIIIGLGHFKADVICNLKCQGKIIIECHEARFFSQSGLSQHQNIIAKQYQKIYRKYYFRIIEKKADAIVTLSQGDKQLWNRAKRVEVIPNFSIMPVHQISNCESKRVIAVGRLSWEKGYDRLLNIWRIIIKRFPNWKLDIYGEGELENILKAKIAREDIKNVEIHKFTNKINEEYSKSSIFAMTSHYEGFALVLLEAMKHGVPCIAYNCPFGPSTIIVNNKCGFLIDNNNEKQYTDKFSLLIEDEHLRKAFSVASIKRSEAFSIERIMTQWISLFENT